MSSVLQQSWNTKVGPIMASSVPSITKAKYLAELFETISPKDNATLVSLIQSIKETSQHNYSGGLDLSASSNWSQTELELTFDDIEEYFFEICKRLRGFNTVQTERILAGLLRNLSIKKRSLILYLFLLGPYGNGLKGLHDKDLIYAKDSVYQYWNWIMIKSLISCEELENKT